MKISYVWLREFIALPLSAEETAKKLTAAGLEIEHIETVQSVPGGLAQVVIGEVLTCEPHPDADRLRLTTVDVGAEAPLPIVCGAPNVAAGQKVVVALPGATLYPSEGEPFTIKKSKIRGAVSEGMICAEDEIGLGQSHAGIMVLDTELPNGTPAATYFNLEDDSVLEIGLTPNRADAASHLGVARDLKALLGLPIHLPTTPHFTQGTAPAPTIDLAAEKGCGRYAAIRVSGVKVGPSPEALQKKLRAIGLSPINNIVDITNYVLHGLGQPLHAFDADKLKTDTIRVRFAQEGEKLVTLDKVERSLKPANLLICDGDTPIALAGVFGGLSTGITEETTEVLIESAWFYPAAIRQSSQVVGLKTDASFRFERGTDPDRVLDGLKLAASLMVEWAGGTIHSAWVDAYPQKIEPVAVPCRFDRLAALTGVNFDPEWVKEVLERLDIKVLMEENYGHPGFEEAFTALVPPYRVDVQREADIAEDLLRLYGFDNVPLSGHLGATYLADQPVRHPDLMQGRVSDLLASRGFNEIMTVSFHRAGLSALTNKVKDETEVAVLNRLSEDLAVMRQSLLFTGLGSVVHNLNRKQSNLRLFEFGKVYFRQPENTERPYTEHYRLSLFVTGNRQAENWQSPAQAADFYTLAGEISVLLEKAGLRDKISTQPLETDELDYGYQLVLNKRVLGQVGSVSPKVLKAWDIRQPVFFAELDWEYLMAKWNLGLQYQEISRFPEVRRDLSLVLDRSVSYAQLLQVAQATERKLLAEVNAFDVYTGDKLEAGKKAYALSFTLVDREQTLTDEVIDRTMNRLMAAFEKELGAVIRR